MTDQTKAITPYDRIRTVMTAKENISEFAKALGVSNRQAAGFVQSALIAVANNNSLMNCTPISIMSSALRAASLGLTCDPEFGHAWLVPFNDRRNNQLICTFQAGYKGYIHLAERTNKYRYINTGAIYDGQTIEEDQLTGKTKIYGTRRSMDSKIVGYFNHFEMLNGFSHTLYMTVEECAAHGKRYSPSYDDPKGKWAKDFDAMCRKTVTKLNLKHYGFFSPNDRQFLEDDDRPEGEVVVDARFIEDVEPERQNFTEAEAMRDLTGEPAPKPQAPAAPGAEASEPPAEHVTYTGSLAKIGKDHAFPALWGQSLMPKLSELGGNAYHLGGILWKLNIPQDTTPARVVEMVKEYLAQQ